MIEFLEISTLLTRVPDLGWETVKSQTTLSERQKDILQTIIITHITTAATVGSRTVAKKMGFRLSPASIRNVMSDLEEMGYVRQPHTSAGRIPTDSGYRFYVDALMEPPEIDREEQAQIEYLYRSKIDEIEELMLLSSKLLSLLTRYTAIVQTPRMETELIRHVDIVRMTSGKALVILITNLGDVKKRVAALPEGTADTDLDRLTAFLNEKLNGLAFSDARKMLDSLAGSEDPTDSRLGSLALTVVREVLSEQPARDLYLNGMENIFNQPEFQDMDRLRPVLRVLDEKQQLNELIESCVSTGQAGDIYIRIGSENPLDDVRSCSFVVSPYRIQGRPTGALGVIGPTRMQYSRASALVAHVANRLSGMLTELSGGD
ncbi:MAG: heat-inducible transcriptional repressor HrcA [Candidatus Abyssubacteria bacterium]